MYVRWRFGLFSSHHLDLLSNGQNSGTIRHKTAGRSLFPTWGYPYLRFCFVSISFLRGALLECHGDADDGDRPVGEDRRGGRRFLRAPAARFLPVRRDVRALPLASRGDGASGSAFRRFVSSPGVLRKRRPEDGQGQALQSLLRQREAEEQEQGERAAARAGIAGPAEEGPLRRWRGRQDRNRRVSLLVDSRPLVPRRLLNPLSCFSPFSISLLFQTSPGQNLGLKASEASLRLNPAK